MERSPLGWVEHPPEEARVHFATSRDWDTWTYRRLAQESRRAGAGFRRQGLKRGDVVILLGRSGPALVSALFGAMLAGATPSLIAPMAAFHDAQTYAEHLAEAIVASRPAMIVTDRDLQVQLSELVADPGVPTLEFDQLFRTGDEVVPGEISLADVAVLQFTAGSTGSRRPVRVAFRTLDANVGAIRRWLRWSDRDAFASWLPLHHDMGLVGGLITPLASRGDLWLLSPEMFIHDPLRWLRCFGERRATLTATPPFALEYVVRRVSPGQLGGLDFSAWRGVVVGAERIEARTLAAFHHLLGPFGFDWRALLPAYGLAEATLAVTGVLPEEGWTGFPAAPESLSPGRRVARSERLDDVIVGCGTPLDGVSVNVVDEHGRRLRQGTVGEIVVKGESVASGYAVETESASLTSLTDGTLRTGDAGFVLAGQLFLIGRLGDGVKVRGRFIFAEQLEVALVAAGLQRRRMAVALGVSHGVPTVVAVLEDPAAKARSLVDSTLRRRSGGARVVLVDVPRGTIPRTSSGKPRRQTLWQAFIAGRLTAHAVTAVRSRPEPESAPAFMSR